MRKETGQKFFSINKNMADIAFERFLLPNRVSAIAQPAAGHYLDGRCGEKPLTAIP